jgi:NAD(P)-dependent dehydrogenase (short-subunit alcohol dehydrogenase family)
MRLTGKIAVITGAGRGIGRAIALAFAAEGAHLALIARTAAELEQAAEEARTRGVRAIPLPCDVTSEEQVKAAMQAALAEFERVDILVNNAGAGAFRPGYGTPLDTWNWMMDVNAKSTFLCTKHIWRAMRKAGGGSIINISSTSGTRAYPLYAAYSASKWGQIGFTKATAEEGKPDNIRVNAIAPGKVDTPMRGGLAEDKSRMLAADDCNGTAIFLASDESRYVTGQVIEVEWFGPEASWRSQGT